MKPLSFEGQNVVYAKEQPEYLELPAHRGGDGVVTTCWGLSWRERLGVFLRGRIWFQQLTFNHALQPQLPSAERPVMGEADTRECA